MFKLKTNEEFQEEITKKNPHIKILEDYKGVSTKILYRCVYCGKERYSIPNALLKGRIPQCCYQRLYKSKSNEEFIEDLKIKNPKVVALDSYKTENVEILFKCLYCGNEWLAKPKTILRGDGCPGCRYVRFAKSRTQDMFDFLCDIKKLYPNINVYGEFKNRHTPIECECLLCGEILKKTPYELEKGYGCRCLRQKSKGESKIKNWLDKNNIKYEMYKTYSDLLGTRNGHLSYDFYVPCVNTLIEYQGQFHDGTTTIKYGYQSDSELSRQQEHDRIKREYAQNNNINLLEVWYWDYDNIEDILDRELIKII